MSDETKLLTPDDELIKQFIARKSRRKLTKKEYDKRMARLYDCNHPSVKFFEEDFTFRCMKCNEKLVQCGSIDEFRLFCELSGRDPKTLIV